MNTRFNNAADAAAALAQNPKIVHQIDKEVRRGNLVTCLLERRISKGKTQEQVAETMGCDSSKISRMESGNDATLKWRDIVAYLNSLGIGLTLCFEDTSLPVAQRIKESVFRIHDDLQLLAKLAKQVGKDDEISQKIQQFYGEVLFNFLVKFKDSHDMLSSVFRVPESHPHLPVTTPAVLALPTEEKPKPANRQLIPA